VAAGLTQDAGDTGKVLHGTLEEDEVEGGGENEVVLLELALEL